ncbi:DEAD/DEAH box helicase [Acidiphilium sp. PM]|uniref:DEAD/DEAH box helicase n=1 Tax=Acidiphilium sp. PM TaxID=1043206 RepID=UPI0002145CDF|nr:DEAD/DEAH box helicase family protein [Acidiphilium sp. PM]EGO93942.1 hypothetical protein APM_3283 [Acidiphilium sp. PM]
MSKRTIAPLVLKNFQQEAVDTLVGVMTDTVEKIKAAPARRREIARRIGCALLEAPTASGKTVMLASTAERVSGKAPVVWFWFAPFKGVVDQTSTALRSVAPALRIRDPKADRVSIGTRPGDVFISTWASVAANNKDTRKMRVDDDELPALDNLLTQIRDAGLVVGVVVDEAHHSFKAGTQAFKFFDEILRPDLLMLATATPDDADVEILRRSLGIDRFQRISISRERVVEERLNKETVKAIAFVAKGTSEKLLDLNEVALRKAIDQHRALKKGLKAAGIPMVPLLLIQAASTGWTPEKVKTFLTSQAEFSEASVGVHTADEPDPDIQALANDPQVEVLIFKMAVATGFDAPRASSLCALRAVQDKGFGLQVIGRIMRVHPALQRLPDTPAEFNTGYVFLGNAESQLGLQQAADQVRSLKNLIQVSTDRVDVYVASADANGEITIEDKDGQRVLVLTPPESWGAYTPSPSAAGTQSARLDEPDPLFDLLDSIKPSSASAGEHAAALQGPGRTPRTNSVNQKAYSYPVRNDVNVPPRLLTETMAADSHTLVDELVKNVVFTPEHLIMVHQHRAEVERKEVDLFDGSVSKRSIERAEISDLFARQNAWGQLRISDYIDPQELAHRLLQKLRRSIENAGQDVPDQKVLRRALNVILVRSPTLCRDALRRAMASCVEAVEADDLPASWRSDFELPFSIKNLYRCVPNGLNTWEVEFADWLDLQEDRVLWWTRNVQNRGAPNGWGVKIILPETGKGYYPDFIVCVNGRKKQDGIALLETKERIDSVDSISKTRNEHLKYGRAIMITYDKGMNKFIRIEYDAALNRNKEVSVFEADSLLLD